MQSQANTFLTLHIALFTPHTPHFTLALHLNSSHLSSSHLIPCLHICQLNSSWLFSCQLLPSTDVYYKSLQTLLPSTICTTKLAQNAFQNYFALQNLHKLLPTTTLYYKACTNDFPALMSTTKKLAQTTSRYYFVLQSLHKLLPSTTLYYKACTNYFPLLHFTRSLHKLLPSNKDFPVLLCTTKLAQNTSQYYFVLQSLHKALPRTTLHYKACTSYFPVLPCTTKLTKTTSQYYKACTNYFPVKCTSQYYFVLQSLRKVFPTTF